MRKLYIFSILILFNVAQFGMGQINSFDSTASNDLNNSEIILPTPEVNPSTAISISVLAKNSTNHLITGIDVQITATDGLFTSNQQTQIVGVIDSNGFFNATWESPFLPFSTSEIVVNFTSKLDDIFSNVSITINKSIRVKYLDTSLIDNSETFYPKEVLNNSITNLSTLVRNQNNESVSGVRVTYLSTGDNNGVYIDNSVELSIYEANSDNLGFVNVSWKAPLLSLNMLEINQTISIEISLTENLSITLDMNIKVVSSFGPRDMKITSSVNSTRLKQGEIAEITLNVLDNSTNTPLNGAQVIFTVEIGKFDGSFDLTYIGVTDVNGEITVLYLSNVTYEQVNDVTVLISYRVIHELYEDKFGNITLLVSRNQDFTSVPTDLPSSTTFISDIGTISNSTETSPSSPENGSSLDPIIIGGGLLIVTGSLGVITIIIKRR